MQVSLSKKNVIYIIGTICLGALGSGLWDLAIKPLLILVIEFFVDVVFGAFQSIQNSVFEDVASLHREITGRHLLAASMGAILGVVIALQIDTPFRRNRNRFTNIPSLPKAERVLGENRGRPATFNLALVSLFICVFIIFTSSRSIYVLEKQDNYLQLKRVISPYLTEEERLEIESAFSLIHSMEAYTSLMNKMRQVAAHNEISLPRKLKG